MADFVYPSNSELRRIAAIKLPRLTADRTIFDIFPVRTSDSPVLMWEQQDNFVGLQQVRGLNGRPPRVNRVGAKRFVARPGVYGEYILIDEEELTARRPWGEFNGTVSIDDLVTEAQDQLLGRELDRIEYIGWTLLTTGTFAVSSASGAVLHTDSITLTTYTATVPWSTVATAEPTKDFRNVKLLARGKGVSFGTQAKAYMNQVTANNLMANTNPNDPLQSRRNFVQITMEEMNRILLGEGLPQLTVMDEGYNNDANVFVPFIPDNKVIVVGQRTDGAPIAEYRMTRNVNNPSMAPGSYDKVVDNGEDEVPREIKVHRGHNGGPVLLFPSAIVLMNV